VLGRFSTLLIDTDTLAAMTGYSAASPLAKKSFRKSPRRLTLCSDLFFGSRLDFRLKNSKLLIIEKY
jgi:hypothetical protein